MSTPGFNAEASLYRSKGSYFAACLHRSEGSTQVAPSQTLGGGGWWPLMKCCGRFPQLGGRIYCIYQQWRPGETCTCEHGVFGEPYFSCRPWVFEP